MMIKIEHLSYWYAEQSRPVIRDLSLAVDAGESICIMGRNGSGKSTLVKLIAGLIAPGRGSVAIGGHRLQAGEVAPDIGLLFQNPDNQMVATLVEKEIAFALENRATPQATMELEITRVAIAFGVAHLRDRLTSELSGGEKQRVALASIMIQQPSVLLLDEPDSYLDEPGRRILATELQRIHQENPTLTELRVTQSRQVASRYQRLLIIDDGQIIGDGRPADLLADVELQQRSGLVVDETPVRLSVMPRRLGGTSPQSGPGRLVAVQADKVDYRWPLAEPVLTQISSAIKTGEIVALVGPTGVGKSTLGLLLCGLLKPTGGEVAYFGPQGVRLERGDLRGKIAAVLQQPERQFFLESCAEEISFGPDNLGVPLDESESRSFFEMVGLSFSKFGKRDPFTLSMGEKRRLALAAVLSLGPSIVIFDEPTAGLDPEGVAMFVALAGALRKAGLGQLLITHDVELVEKLADRVLSLEA